MAALFDDVIGGLYAAAVDPDGVPGALQDLAEHVGAMGVLLLHLAPERGIGLVASPSLAPAMAEYEAHWATRDPRVIRGHRFRLRSGLCREEDLAITPEFIRRDPFYQEFLRTDGLERFVACLSMPVPGQVYSLSFQRWADRGAFPSKELDLIGRAAGHAVRALTIAHELSRARARADALAEAFSALDFAVFALGRDGRVLHLNAAARALAGRGVEVRSGRMEATVPAQSGLLGAFLRAALDDRRAVPPEPVVLSRAEASPLLLQAIPMRLAQASGFDRLIGGNRGVLLFAFDLAANRRRHFVASLAQLGLTPNEARIAAAVGLGATPREAAVELGISENTIRTVLKTVFQKLQLGRQSRLAVLVTTLMRATVAR